MTKHFYRLFLPLHFIAVFGAIFVEGVFSGSSLLITAVVFFMISNLGINLGLHRVLTHGHGKLPVFWKRALVFVGLFSGGGSPIYWAMAHRHHHQQSDTPLDVHSPRSGFFWSFFGWMIVENKTPVLKWSPGLVRDVISDPAMRFMDRYYYSIVSVVGLILGVFGGLQLFIVAFCWPMLLCIYHESLINYLGHKSGWGYRRYEIQDESRNFRLWGALSGGAAFQNNHHHSSEAPKFSHGPGEFDYGFWILRMIQFVSRVKL